MNPTIVLEATFFQVMAAVTSLVAALTALVAVFWGAKAAQETAREQIAASSKIAQKEIWGSTVSAARRQWIDQLRSDVAHLMTSTGQLCNICATSLPSQDTLFEYIERISHKTQMLGLLLNHEEPLHLSLFLAATRTMGAATIAQEAFSSGNRDKIKESAIQLGTIQAEIMTAAQAVLKAEWEKVKKLE